MTAFSVIRNQCYTAYGSGFSFASGPSQAALSATARSCRTLFRLFFSGTLLNPKIRHIHTLKEIGRGSELQSLRLTTSWLVSFSLLLNGIKNDLGG
jgi:hypothetical protein